MLLATWRASLNASSLPVVGFSASLLCCSMNRAYPVNVDKVVDMYQSFHSVSRLLFFASQDCNKYCFCHHELHLTDSRRLLQLGLLSTEQTHAETEIHAHHLNLNVKLTKLSRQCHFPVSLQHHCPFLSII